LKNCPVTVNNAKVRFDGTPDLSNSSLLAIDSSVAGATGVAINLMTRIKPICLCMAATAIATRSAAPQIIR
jgi:type 1 fimbria pilin